ncbi:MAG: archaemetzincin family Zn-dependent metalloprotease [Candidatus Hydrothermarchaeota archaeon]
MLRIGEVEDKILSEIKNDVEEAFKGIVTIKLSDTFLSIPEESWNKSRRQYKSDIILEKIDKMGRNMGLILVGITPEDLYVSGLNFVFGQAKIHGNACIVSLHRLRPEFYGSIVSGEVLKKRLKKEIIHELGHVLGLTHCFDKSCVMSFSNSIKDVDYKREELCHNCWRKLNEDKIHVPFRL